MITRVASKFRLFNHTSIASASTGPSTTFLKIGGVKVARRVAKNSELVPAIYGSGQPSKDLLPHLKWLIQKDLLKQDVFLLGVPGKLRLELVLRYLEATNSEFEYLPITRDTTEADIKQRREIRNGTALYTDLCAVRAAISGRVLVIDGVERAERNVLPVLNNLLENREMQLDDGRFLMKHDKFDQLREKYDAPTLKKMGLERVSENFHVIALGLPVPRFPGNTLDPPFRSRFQCRNVEEYSFHTLLERAQTIAPRVNQNDINDLVSLVYAYNSEASASRPRISTSVLEHVLNIWNANPFYSSRTIADFLYPDKEVLSDSEKGVMDQFKNKFELWTSSESRKIVTTEKEMKDGITVQNVNISDNKNNVQLEVPTSHDFQSIDKPWIATPKQETLLADLAVAFAKGDFLLIGSKGSGKSRILHELSHRLNYNYVSMVLHQDMNTRELIQRRHMKENGDTVWEDSQLVRAAREGDVCVLDGVDAVHPSALMSLSQLVYHRRFDLPDGSRLVGAKEFDAILQRDGLTEDTLNERGVYRIPETFRLLFVGESQSKEHKWINENVLSLVPFYSVPKLSISEQLEVISKMTDGSNMNSVEKLTSFVQTVKESDDAGLRNSASSLTLRRLIHIAKRDKMQPGHLRTLVEKAALARFLPLLTKGTFEHELTQAKIFDEEGLRSKDEASYIDIIRQTTTSAEDEPLIPNVLFHDNEQHVEILEDMARDMKLGSHLLLIGNQGVGKNKLTDRFLHLVNRPRQYMQLHRDTTVQTLTMQTVVENGIIKHEDSPLVKAARNGQILVIDEADKAPLHVIAILKSLLDTGTLVLGDGRTLRQAHLVDPNNKNDRIIPIDPNFRIIMLANRPGFPFLGNNLFAVLGDLFAIHTIDHPSRKSELEMIQKYGPNVDIAILNKLETIFTELREKTDQGLLQYPWSTRELVNIVRHCDQFPDDPLTEVVRNVFDFDSYSEDTISTIESVFQKHGIPLGVSKGGEKLMVAERKSIGELKKVGHWSFERLNQHNGFRFSQPEHVKLSSIQPINFETHPLEKSHTRNEIFTEQECVWKLPLTDSNIVSDGIRIGDDLVVATVNPMRLYVTKQFLNASTTEELDVSALIPRIPRYKYQPRIKLAHLGGSKVLLHEEVSNAALFFDLNENTGAVIQRSATISDQIGAMFTGSKYPWRMAPSSEGSAMLYERNGQELCVYSSVDGSPFAESISVPFKIQRVLPIGKDQWMIVSTEGDNYALQKEHGSYVIDKMNQDIGEHIAPVSVKVHDKDLIMVSDPFYYLQGSTLTDTKDNSVVGVRRRKPENVVDPKRPYYMSEEITSEGIDDAREVVFLGRNIIRSQPNWAVPHSALGKDIAPRQVAGFLEAIDTESRQICHVPVPLSSTQFFYGDWVGSITKTGFVLTPWSDEKVLTIDTTGGIRSYELVMSSMISSFNEWKRMTSGNEEKLRMEFEREEDKVDMSKLDEPKLGKVDPNNTPHHGGNQWMGGTGGYNTAGLGGIGGPFRLDAGHDVHQMPDFAKQKVPEHILKKAREIAKKEYAKKLREINMSKHDASEYEKLWTNVERYSKKLSSVIDQLEAKRKEREWAKHQTSGDLDDGKLIEGVTGEQNIYRRRIDKTPDPGAPQVKPKRIKFCFDVSGSMYRFNGYDKRLQNSLETALMMMTALEGKSEKVVYDIVGHSGDSPCVRFVKENNHPKNNKERLDVLKRMLAHTQYCVSGDNTVECLQYAVKELGNKDDFDETVVILVSDANLERYGIEPYELQREMIKDPNINCFVVFIGSLGEQAERCLRELPTGKAFVLKETMELPKIMETIFSSTIAQ